MNIQLNVSFVIFSVSMQNEENYRKLPHKKLSVLLVQDDEWKLPTKNVDNICDIDNSICEFVKELCGIDNIYSEQLYTFSKQNGESLEINQTYISLINRDTINNLVDNCKWFDVDLVEDRNGYVCNLQCAEKVLSFNVSKTLKPQTTDRYTFTEISSTGLYPNHSVYLVSGIERLRNKINYTDIVFNMMPPLFTLKDLQQVFEAVLNKKLLDPAFRRVIASKVESTTKMTSGKGHRPSVLFRHKI